MSFGGGGSTTTNSVDERFSPLINYATQAAKGVNDSGYVPYAGDRFAGLNDTQKAGIGMIQNRALNGDPTMNQANQTLQNTLKGGNTNPYLDSMVDRAQKSTMSNLAGLNARSGSFGNSGIMETGTRQMGEIASNMYGNAYNTDRANQMQALNLAPQYGQQSYTDAAQLMKAGQTQQDQSQQGKDFAYQQFTDAKNLPYKNMAAYTGLLGASGSTGTSRTSGGGK